MRHRFSLLLLATVLCWLALPAQGAQEQSITLLAGETLSTADLRMKLASATTCTRSGTVDGQIGLNRQAAANGGQVVVELLKPGQTYTFTASEGITAGATVYAAADGKVADTAAGNRIGIALTTAAGDGSTLHCVYDPAPLAFLTPELTGNGSEQSIVNPFGVIPTVVLCTFTELSGGADDIAYGTHTASYLKVTVTNAVKYRLLLIR